MFVTGIPFRIPQSGVIPSVWSVNQHETFVDFPEYFLTVSNMIFTPTVCCILVELSGLCIVFDQIITLHLQQKLNKQQVWGGSTTVRKQISGTASVAFTPMQGLEIVNPGAAEQKIREANEKYFSNTAGFMSVMKGP